MAVRSRDRLRSLAKASMVYTPEDVDEAQRFSQALCELQQQKWSDVLKTFQKSPILVHYQGDSTPIRHGVHIAGQSSSATSASVRRFGTQTSEAYLHRMYLATGNEHTDFVKAHRVLPPVVLASKASWHLWACVQAVCPPLIRLGHQGISLSVYVFDRAVVGSLGKKLHQTHEHERTTVEPAAVPVADRDWVFSLGCAIHDAHNSLQWAMAMTCDVSCCCGSLHSLLQCLRRSLPCIHEHLGSFLGMSVQFRLDVRDEEVSQMYWASLGVGVDWLELAVSLDVHVVDGKVWLNPQWQGRPDALESLVSFYLYCFRFRKATESRWLSIGVACRCVLLSLALGLPTLLQWLLDQPKVPESDLSGWSKHFVGELPKFVAVCAFASRIADAAIANLLEDDRLLIVYGDLKQAVEFEIGLLQELHHDVWLRVAELAVPELGHQELRSSTITASMTSLGYFSFKVYRHIQACPWRLALGNIEQNLDSIDDLDPLHVDPLCQKIRRLLNQGH